MVEFQPGCDVKVDATRIHQLLSEIQSDPMGGWYDLPVESNSEEGMKELNQIKAAADQIRSDSEYLVCVGIGGSYLGHRAVIEAIQPLSTTRILYAGNHLSTREFQRLLDTLGDADFSVNVISKSGTTTEPAVAFRLLKEKLHQKYGDAAAKRIYATTDARQGALYEESVAEGYTRFVVPDNVGGRYSVLTAVGLLPLAVAGIDIDGLLSGAFAERQSILDARDDAITTHPIAQYATLRADLLRQKHDVEILASFEPCLQYFEEWWKQLFGESEGKNHQGIFPASVIYTTDLHSLGQYLQEGRRNIFETVIKITRPGEHEIKVPQLENDLDGLKYLEGQTLDYLNQTALAATVAAHREGGIPVSEITILDLHERSIGSLIYFFELACALSAKLSKVNPFDQPGVEAYKRNMFHLLGKPGF